MKVKKQTTTCPAEKSGCWSTQNLAALFGIAVLVLAGGPTTAVAAPGDLITTGPLPAGITAGGVSVAVDGNGVGHFTRDSAIFHITCPPAPSPIQCPMPPFFPPPIVFDSCNPTPVVTFSEDRKSTRLNSSH